MLTIAPERSPHHPLDQITVRAEQPGSISLRDGRGREYARLDSGGSATISGALGGHIALLLDAEDRILDSVGFAVDTSTTIDDGGRFAQLFTYLRYTMLSTYGGRQHQLIGGRIYQHFISWLRDHTHTMKGMQYFERGLKSGFELYAERQREDGMIWDRVYRRAEHQQWRDYTFRHGGFIAPVEDGRIGFERIPVENDVEFLFVECLHRSWKASGDSAWMARWLDHCLKAVRYATSDPYRWSERYRLLKRGYTIDTWDFQNRYDAAEVVDEHGIRLGENVVLLGKTRFGVFHGDNTGMAASCRLLAEMLRVAGRSEEATAMDRLSDELQARLDALSWNGRFYRHWIEEEPRDPPRDFGGVDEAEQVTLSNAYALNRRIEHEQAVAIIRSYQRIRAEMPSSSPGEWYNCYPPYEHDFHNPKWEYMNGGVSTIVAGELAKGACEHGFEAYAADILQRLCALAEAHGGKLDVCFKGALSEPPAAEYRSLDLSSAANVDTHGSGAPGVPGWTGDGPNDLAAFPSGEQRFGHVPFTLLDPARNGRRAAIGISRRPGYASECRIPVGATASSIYLLHTLSGGGTAGMLDLVLADGSIHPLAIQPGRNIDSWFMPGGSTLDSSDDGVARQPDYRLAWRGANAVFDNVGVYCAGISNPRPEVPIQELVLRVPEIGSSVWLVLGCSLSSGPVWFPSSDVSYGIPNNWGAGAVVYALLEGLAGLQDAGLAFDRLRLRPRWSAATTDAVSAVAKYEESGGYAAYRYHHRDGSLSLELATSAEAIDAAILLPTGAEVTRLVIDGSAVAPSFEQIESSRYLRLPMTGLGAHRAVVELA